MKHEDFHRRLRRHFLDIANCTSPDLFYQRRAPCWENSRAASIRL
jgi:hypothetical protein